MSQDASITTKEKQMEEIISLRKKANTENSSCLSKKEEKTLLVIHENLLSDSFYEEPCKFIDGH